MIVSPFCSILPSVGKWSPWLLLCSCRSGTHRSAFWLGWIKELARRLYFIFFRLVEWSAVVLMLGLMDLFATAFISFISKNWQAVKWNFGLDFQLDCLETFVKIFCFCVAAASSTVIVSKGRKVIYCTDFCWVKKNHCLGDSHISPTPSEAAYLLQCVQYERLITAYWIMVSSGKKGNGDTKISFILH